MRRGPVSGPPAVQAAEQHQYALAGDTVEHGQYCGAERYW